VEEERRAGILYEEEEDNNLESYMRRKSKTANKMEKERL
jgi:hypothetical protein